ncbi:MAG: ABC transporter ATP-binding protein [Alphaproteobacteria bacterium]|nr:ABC transporter ATP-binding protein [Alphaproteobacteria bacterium]
MIVAENLTKTFDEIKAVDGISFTAKKGVIALLGQNGAGKTTLIRLLTDYLSSDCGKVLICGEEIAEKRQEALLNIGYVPENNPLYPEMTAFDYVKFVADLWKIKKTDFQKNFRLLAEKLEIKGVMTQKISTLSKGYKRRVAIAAALVHLPKVVILDEPTDGLDPNQKQFVRQFIKEYAKSNLVLVSTHIMEDVEAIADRILLVEKGRLLLDTTVAEFKKKSGGKDMISAFHNLTAHKE